MAADWSCAAIPKVPQPSCRFHAGRPRRQRPCRPFWPCVVPMLRWECRRVMPREKRPAKIAKPVGAPHDLSSRFFMIDVHIHGVPPSLPGVGSLSPVLAMPPETIAAALRAQMQGAGVTDALAMGCWNISAEDPLGIAGTLQLRRHVP